MTMKLRFLPLPGSHGKISSASGTHRTSARRSFASSSTSGSGSAEGEQGIEQGATPEKAPSPGAPPKADRFAVPREMGILRRGEPRHPLRLADIVTRIIDNRTRYEARNAKREKKELNYMLHQKTFIEEL